MLLTSDRPAFLAAVTGDGAKPAGVLRVTAPGSFPRMPVAPALLAFRDRYPKIDFDPRLSDEIPDVVDGALDRVVRNAELPDSSMIARKLAADRRRGRTRERAQVDLGRSSRPR